MNYDEKAGNRFFCFKFVLMKLVEPNGLIDNLYKYVNTNIELAKLEVQERIEDGIKRVMIMGLMAIIALLFLLFFFITLALLLNYWLDSSFMGFLIVTVLLAFLLGGAFFVIQRKEDKANEPEQELSIDKD